MLMLDQLFRQALDEDEAGGNTDNLQQLPVLGPQPHRTGLGVVRGAELSNHDDRRSSWRSSSSTLMSQGSDSSAGRSADRGRVGEGTHAGQRQCVSGIHKRWMRTASV